MACERAGVDAADADDALRCQLVVEAAPRTPAARYAGRITDDVTADPDPTRLGVLVVDAGVADVRRRLYDDLAVVGRVGQRLLVTGHAGVEDGFTERLAGGAVRLAAKGAPVLEHQNRRAHRTPSPTLLGESHKSRLVSTWLSGSVCSSPSKVGIWGVMRASRRGRLRGRAGRLRPHAQAAPDRRRACCGCGSRTAPGRPPSASWDR